MKKNILALMLLATCMMFGSCGKEDGESGIDMVQVIESGKEPEAGGDMPETCSNCNMGGKLENHHCLRGQNERKILQRRYFGI